MRYTNPRLYFFYTAWLRFVQHFDRVCLQKRLCGGVDSYGTAAADSVNDDDDDYDDNDDARLEIREKASTRLPSCI